MKPNIGKPVVRIILIIISLLLLSFAPAPQIPLPCVAQVTEFVPGAIRAVVSCPIYPTGWNENSYGYALIKEVGDPSDPIAYYMGATFVDGLLVFDGFWWPAACPSWTNLCKCDRYHSDYVVLQVTLYPDPACWWCSTATAYGPPLYWGKPYCTYCPYIRK